METFLYNTLLQIGADPSLVGFDRALSMVMAVIREGTGPNSKYRQSFMSLYKDEAIKCNSTVYRVERSLRSLCEHIFSNQSEESKKAIKQVFGCSNQYTKGKATNKQFIWALVKYYEHYGRNHGQGE